jgi:hypothetical protein
MPDEIDTSHPLGIYRLATRRCSKRLVAWAWDPIRRIACMVVLHNERTPKAFPNCFRMRLLRSVAPMSASV